MDVAYINPFIESVGDLFTNMLSAKVSRGKVGVSGGDFPPRAITGLIGLSGPTRGTVALSFPVPTALAMVNKLLGSETRVVDNTVTDAVAEMVNIVAGGAKARLSGDGTPLDLSLPTVVRGENYDVEYPSGVKWLEVAFESELGDFRLRVTLEENSPSSDAN